MDRLLIGWIAAAVVFAVIEAATAQILTLWFCIGSIGAILGMYIFHHNTKHWYFQIGIPAIMIIQIAAVYWLSQKGVITLPFAP